MSIREQATDEMRRAGLPQNEIDAMEIILETFFETWDSGGAVSVMIPVLHRLLCGRPLTPLTGQADEWVDVGAQHGKGPGRLLQNRRCSSVFREHHVDRFVDYDIELPGDAFWRFGRVEFPYEPVAVVPEPVVVVKA